MLIRYSNWTHEMNPTGFGNMCPVTGKQHNKAHLIQPRRNSTCVRVHLGPQEALSHCRRCMFQFALRWLQRLRHLADSSNLRFWDDGAFRCLPGGAKQDRGASWGRDVKVWARIRHRLDSHEALVRGLTSGCLLQRARVCVCVWLCLQLWPQTVTSDNELKSSPPRDSTEFSKTPVTALAELIRVLSLGKNRFYFEMKKTFLDGGFPFFCISFWDPEAQCA